MGVIAVRLSEKDELKIKQMAGLESKSVSEYCREKILTEQTAEQPLNRSSIESEIDELKKTIARSNDNMIKLSKIILGDTKEYGELILGFFDEAIEDAEIKKRIYQEARNKKLQYIKENFGSD